MRTYYGIKCDRSGYTHIFSHWLGTKACLGRKPTAILQLELIEDENGTHWAWQATGDDIYSMIMPSKLHFECCFPYGSKAEVDRGKGRVVRLTVREIGVQFPAESFG